MSIDLSSLLAKSFGSLPAMVAQQSALQPQRTALVLDDLQLDFAALNAGIDRVASAFQRQGLQPGDVVAICANTSVPYVLAYFGALRAGVVVAPLAPSSTASHLSAMLENSGAKVVLQPLICTVLHWMMPPKLAKPGASGWHPKAACPRLSNHNRTGPLT